MVMEYCPGGELFTMIRKQPNGRLNENQVNFYAAEVVLVLEYIHSRGYIYRGILFIFFEFSHAPNLFFFFFFFFFLFFLFFALFLERFETREHFAA